MPFVEILAPPAPPDARAALARGVTDGITRGFGGGPETVTIYFLPVEPGAYAHAGEMGMDARSQRVFVKIHAFRRDTAKRRAVAASVTEAVGSALSADPADIAVYFMELEPDEVAHGARLASD